MVVRIEIGSANGVIESPALVHRSDAAYSDDGVRIPPLRRSIPPARMDAVSRSSCPTDVRCLDDICTTYN